MDMCCISSVVSCFMVKFDVEPRFDPCAAVQTVIKFVHSTVHRSSSLSCTNKEHCYRQWWIFMCKQSPCNELNASQRSQDGF